MVTAVGEPGARPPRPGTAARWAWVITIGLCAIGVAVVARRAGQLLPFVLGGELPPARGTGPYAALDDGFTRKAWLTLAHIAAALLFVILAPIQFSRRVRGNHPRYHRTAGWAAAGAGAAAGITALVLSCRDPIGGANEAAASIVFGLLFLFALTRGVTHARRGALAAHREWMVRAFAIALAVATTRPIVGVFFATSRLTGLTPREFFGIAFWLGFTAHLIAAEAWINRTRPAAAATTPRRNVA